MKTFKIKSLSIHITLIVTIIMAAASTLPAEAKKKAEASIHFTESTFDFGQLSAKKGAVSHVFTFTNSGNSNLAIINARADCGCTKPTFSEEPTAPGKTGTIKVTYLPSGKGHFTKKVTVTTNGTPHKVNLIIKGEVTE